MNLLDARPATIINGRKAIMTKPIYHPVIKASTIPETPILILVRIDVMLLTKALCTFAIWMYILEHISAGLFLSCQATSW